MTWIESTTLVENLHNPQKSLSQQIENKLIIAINYELY